MNRHASDDAKTCNSKPWRYLLAPHDVLGTNLTLDFIAKKFGVS